MQHQLTFQQSFTTTTTPSPNVRSVAAMFGLGLDDARCVEVLPRMTLELCPHQLIFLTGPSGGGKSTLLRTIEREATLHDDLSAIDFAKLDTPAGAGNLPLVDCFDPRPLPRVLKLLSRAGLGDAFVMLRKPRELSDGQRYRFRLAQCMAMFDEQELHGSTNATSSQPAPLFVILADEFAATLDRLTASIIARNVRKWVSRMPICFIAATTHDDLLEPLQPDVVIEKGFGGEVEVSRGKGPGARD